MLDGVPINDPFGGWVYWSRIPLETAERIEVVDGSSSSLYGNYAMGGVINVITNAPTRRTFEMKSQYGSRNSPKVDFYGSERIGKLGIAVDGNFFDTDGYPIVRASERGRVDNNAAVKFWNANVKADLRADGSNPDLRALRLFQREPRQRQGQHHRSDRGGQRHDLEVGQCGCQSASTDESDLQATVFVDVRLFTATSSRFRQRRRRAASGGCATRPCRRLGSAGWCSGRARSGTRSFSPPAQTGDGLTGTPGERARRSYGNTGRPQSRLRRDAAQRRFLRAGFDRPELTLHHHAELACRSMAQLRRPQISRRAPSLVCQRRETFQRFPIETMSW